TSQMMYIIIAVDPESEKQLFVGSFQEGEAGEQEWRPYEEGYLFGPYHIKHDLSSASRVSETLFDASADLKRLLIGIGEGDQVTVACLDVTNGEKETQQTVYLAGFDDTEEAGIWGSLSPDGEWIALAAYDRGSFTNTLRRCDREQEISIEGDPSVAIGDFSGNSRWYVYPQSMPEGGEGLLLLDLELEESESIGTINGSPMYWVKSPISSEIIETYPITGMVSTESGEPLQGVAIMIDGIQLTETGVDGTFTITGLQADTYTLSPHKEGATFTPESRSVRLPRDASENNFVGSGIEGSAPVETLNPTESSLPTETPIQEVSELESNFPIVLPATQLTDETTLLLIAICGGGLLVLGLLFFVVYLIRRSLRKRSAQETPKDPNAIVPEPSEAEVMEWLQEGAALVKGGDIDTGEAKLRQVIEYAPENPSAWMWMG
ncbi:MAG: carboxypeptidase regulatory-like domain-containing protein, partial [Anaerolineales bacterium]|nr:carboxypeptidase regulatory-like domain-containing protein [Anaerolineales bacterium]